MIDETLPPGRITPRSGSRRADLLRRLLRTNILRTDHKQDGVNELEGVSEHQLLHLTVVDAAPVRPRERLLTSLRPSVLFVRTGHRAQFLNSDEELHNINVKNGKTLEQAFNVALPPGITYVHTFERSGVYDVSCDAHSGMSAQIIAASSPYVALADSNGHFEIPNVVPGTYALTVYVGAEPIEKTIEVTGSRTEVDVTRQ